MSSSGQKRKSEAAAIPEWMRLALECPVCLEIIMDPPIYVCENPQGHTVCSTCHESLKKERKPCPVCRQELKSRRNVTLECMLEKYPYKKCKFNGCDFRGSDAEPVKKHEDECDNRYVPCAWCNDDKISLKGLVHHLVEKHYNGFEFKVASFGVAKLLWTLTSDLKESQYVIPVAGDHYHKFLVNWCSLDEYISLFWVAYIGKKDLSLT